MKHKRAARVSDRQERVPASGRVQLCEPMDIVRDWKRAKWDQSSSRRKPHASNLARPAMAALASASAVSLGALPRASALSRQQVRDAALPRDPPRVRLSA